MTALAGWLRAGRTLAWTAVAQLRRGLGQRDGAVERWQDRERPGSGDALKHQAYLTTLAYELLDAHLDTADLAAEMGDDLEWRLHLDYLCALQRMSREMLARIGLAEST